MGNLLSQRKLGLLPESPDQCGTALTAPQLSPRLSAQVKQVFQTEVRQGMLLEMSPNIFDGVEFRGVSRQLRQVKLALGSLDIAAHRPAAMHGQPVPDHQQRARNLAAQVAEKLDGLPAFDAAAREAKVKFPPSDAGDDGELAPRVTEHQLVF